MADRTPFKTAFVDFEAVTGQWAVMLPWALQPPKLLEGHAWNVGGGSSYAISTPQHLIVMSSPVAAAHPRDVVDSVPAVFDQVAAQIGDSGVGEVQITGPACIYRLTEVMRVELRRDTRRTAAGAAATSDILAAAGAAAASDGAVGGSPSAGAVLGGSLQPVVKPESSEQLVRAETAQLTAAAEQSGEEERLGKRLRSRHSDFDGRCLCNGNCGSKVCKSNLNKNIRSQAARQLGVCTNTVMDDEGGYASSAGPRHVAIPPRGLRLRSEAGGGAASIPSCSLMQRKQPAPRITT